VQANTTTSVQGHEGPVRAGAPNDLGRRIAVNNARKNVMTSAEIPIATATDENGDPRLDADLLRVAIENYASRILHGRTTGVLDAVDLSRIVPGNGTANRGAFSERTNVTGPAD